MARELRNALADLNTAKEYAGNALSRGYDMGAQGLQNIVDYYGAPSQSESPDDELYAMLLCKYGGNLPAQNAEYLGTPVAPVMLPAALAFRGGQSVGQAMRGMGAYSPRAEFLGQARETRPALQRLGRWMQEEFF